MTIRRGYGILTRGNGAYEGVIKVSGFPYAFRVTREGDGIAVVITDAPIDEAKRAADDAAQEAYLDRTTRLVTG